MPVPTNTLWTQEQAPSGYWADSIGFNYHDGPSYAQALQDAKDHCAYLKKRNKVARIVRKYVEVVEG